MPHSAFLLSFLISALWTLCAYSQGTQFSYNGLANTPQMGWVSQATLVETACLCPIRTIGMPLVVMSVKSSY